MKNLFKTIFFVAILFLASCKEEKKINPEQDQATTVSNERKQAEDSYQSTQDFAQKAMETPQVQAREASTYNNKNFDTYVFSAYNLSGCATVTVEGNPTSPNGTGTILRTITLNFGTQGCVGTDGRKRKGKVIYTYQRPTATGVFNPFNNVGTVVTVNFDNHYVNGIKLEGVTTSTCTAFSFIQGNLSKSETVIVTGGKLVYSDGTSQLWACNYQRNISAQLDNNFVVNVSSAIFTMSGMSNGTTRGGVSYNTVINDTNTDRCLWKLACPTAFVPSIEPNVFDPVVLPVQGKMTLTFGQNVAIFDFGSGACDNQYSLTINGNTTIVTI